MLSLLLSIALGCSCEMGTSIYTVGGTVVGTNATVLINHAGERPPEDGRIWLRLQDDREARLEAIAVGEAYDDGYTVVQRYAPVERLPANARVTTDDGFTVLLTGPDKTEFESVTALPEVAQGVQYSRWVEADEEDSCGTMYFASWGLTVREGHWTEVEVLDEDGVVLHRTLTPYGGFSYGLGPCRSVGNDIAVDDRPRIRARLMNYGGLVGPWTEPVGTDYIDPPEVEGSGCQMTPVHGAWPMLGLSLLGLAGLRRRSPRRGNRARHGITP